MLVKVVISCFQIKQTIYEDMQLTMTELYFIHSELQDSNIKMGFKEIW
jgi:hypothetical protein